MENSIQTHTDSIPLAVLGELQHGLKRLQYHPRALLVHGCH